MVQNTSPTHVLHLCHIWSDSVKRSNKEEATELTRQKFKMTAVTFNWARHIAPSCVVCLPHMKWFGQIGTKPRSGQKLKMTAVTFNCARHIAPSCVVRMPHMKWFGQIGTRPRADSAKIWNNRVTLILYLSSWKWFETHRPHMCCIYAT